MSSLKIHDVVTFPEKYWNSEFSGLFPVELIQVLIHLHEKLNPKRKRLLEERSIRQKYYDEGGLPGFLPENSEAASGSWKISPIPKELLVRRVEITGPVNSTKTVINMLNRNEDGSRADMAMLDFEDSMKPSFDNVLNGFKNVIGAVTGELSFSSETKNYHVNPHDKAYVMVRVRGLHLDEVNFKIHGVPVSAALFDLCVCFFHTAKLYLEQGLTPKYYVPKCEHFLEARWWSELFYELERLMGLRSPTLRATFLIETLPATFQTEEILYEIRDHAVGLNVGRWDKIFSDIKILKNHPDRIIADRGSISMETTWMEHYARRVVKICHDRGAFAIGGMAAYTPGKTKEERDEQCRKVFNDKKREASWGHDGCWVSHPYFIGVAMEAMNFDNQLGFKSDFNKYETILPTSEGPHSLKGLRINIRVGIAYMYGWEHDVGCIALDHLMEDLATLEISRAQTWQWLHHQIILDDGIKVTQELITHLFSEEYEKLLKEFKAEFNTELHPRLETELIRARVNSLGLYTSKELQDFLTRTSEQV